MLAWVRNHLDNIQPEDFYKEFNYPHTTRSDAEKKLQQLLSSITEENSKVNRKKAKFLLSNFKSWVQSTKCETFWLNITKESYEIHATTNAIKDKAVLSDIHTQELNVRKRKQADVNLIRKEYVSDRSAEIDAEENPFLNSPPREDIECDSVLKIIIEETASGLGPAGIKNFTAAFKAMRDEQKWRLSTGKMVEDALFDFGRKCTQEHLCHSFVLDPDDSSYVDEGVFTAAELKEIRLHKVHNLPEMPEALLKYLMTFAKNNIVELRHALRQTIDNGLFNREIHHDFDWLQLAMHSLVREYESGTLKHGHQELWYNIHLWAPVIDQCFADVADMEVIRWKTGDLILRTTADLEFGAAEAGRFFKSERGTKWMVESGLKLPKMLKDMLVQLADEAGWSTDIVRQLRTFGFIHGGRCQLTMELDSPEGYVCRVHRGDVFKVAESALTHPKETLPLLTITWKIKAAVKECLALVLSRGGDNQPDEMLRWLKNLGSRGDAEDANVECYIPHCFQTPVKKTKNSHD